MPNFKIIPEMAEQLQAEYLFRPKGPTRIATDYGIAENTVRSHIKSVMKFRDPDFTFESKMDGYTRERWATPLRN